MIKVGLIGFGGGSALIPIVHKEVVDNAGSMSEDDYVKHTVVANITPGALPVKLGATCGFQLSGAVASLVGAYGVAIPGVFGTVLIIAIFSVLGPWAVHYLNSASVGITVFIVFLLLNYVGRTIRSGNLRVNAAICLVAFLLTGDKVMREIIEMTLGLSPHALGQPLLNLPMIRVMILAFYLIFYFQLVKKSAVGMATGMALGMAYAVLSGSAARRCIPHAESLCLVVVALFAVSVVYCWWRGRRNSPHGKGQGMGLQIEIVATMVLFLAVPLLPVAIGFTGSYFPSLSAGAVFLGNILVSTVTSFGGGEAYVAVADSIFVQSGQVAADLFYNRVVPIANALPGPILIKIAAALGFSQGYASGSMAKGVLLAAACGTLAIGACCSVALLVLNFYEALRHSVFVMSLKRYILPVICGTLVTTSLSMLHAAMKITGSYALSPAATLAIMLVGVGATLWTHIRFKIPDIILLISWTAVSVLCMSCFAA